MPFGIGQRDDAAGGMERRLIAAPPHQRPTPRLRSRHRRSEASNCGRDSSARKSAAVMRLTSFASHPSVRQNAAFAYSIRPSGVMIEIRSSACSIAAASSSRRPSARASVGVLDRQPRHQEGKHRDDRDDHREVAKSFHRGVDGNHLPKAVIGKREGGQRAEQRPTGAKASARVQRQPDPLRERLEQRRLTRQ